MKIPIPTFSCLGGVGLLLAGAATLLAVDRERASQPTHGDVAYGADPKQVLDFWRAKSDSPTPVLFYIHGGGWWGLDKAEVTENPAVGVDIPRYLAAGISVVAINYRFIVQAMAADVRPPVQWPLHDAARALQFVRSRARGWNLDPIRIAASGASAGACSSLWLAFHDDLADSKNADPIARESTRPWCVAVLNAQTTLDPRQMVEWTPNSRYGGHAFGFTDGRVRDGQFPRFLAEREHILSWIREYSPFALVSPDDPPVYLLYRNAPGPGEPQPDPTHTANFGVKLQEELRRVGVNSELVYPGAPDVRHAEMQDYLMAKLLAPSAAAKPSAGPPPPECPPPTFAEVAYGSHTRQVLDFWRANTTQPAPVVVYIHGGSWLGWHKVEARATVPDYLAAGISVVAINYRLIGQAEDAGIDPPVKWPLHDAARAVQFVRTHAADWNVNRERIGAAGSSAGACSALWLALHDDLADLRSADPVARESTRLWCMAGLSTQTTLDPQQMVEWTPNSWYGGHAFGFPMSFRYAHRVPGDVALRELEFREFLAARTRLLPAIREFSPFEHAGPGDPPVYLIYPAPPAMGKAQDDPTHTANFGVQLAGKLRAAGGECELVYPGATYVEHPRIQDFLIARLREKVP